MTVFNLPFVVFANLSLQSIVRRALYACSGLFLLLASIAQRGLAQEVSTAVNADGADVILVVDGSLSMPIGGLYTQIFDAIKTRPPKFPTSDAAPKEMAAYLKFRDKFLADHRLLPELKRKEFINLLVAKLNRIPADVEKLKNDDLLDQVALETFRDQEFAKVSEKISDFLRFGLLPQVPPCSLTVISFRSSREIKTLGTYDATDPLDARKALLKELGTLQVKHGGSAIAAALKDAYEKAATLREKNKNRRQYILLITDGDDFPALEVPPGVGAKIAPGQKLVERLPELSQLFQSPKYRVREHFSLWYGHIGDPNKELLESIAKLKGEAKPIDEFRLSGLMIREAELGYGGLIPGGTIPEQPIQLSVDGYNLPEGSQLQIGQVGFPRSWKVKGRPTPVSAEFVSLTDKILNFRFSDGQLTGEALSRPLDLFEEEDQQWALYFEDIRQQLVKEKTFALTNSSNLIPLSLNIKKLPDSSFTIRLPLSTNNGLIITNRPYVDISYRIGTAKVDLLAVEQFEKGLHNANPGLAKLKFTIDPPGYERGNFELKLTEPLKDGLTLQVNNKPIGTATATSISLNSLGAVKELTLQAMIGNDVPDGEYPLPLEVRYNNEELLKNRLGKISVSRPQITISPRKLSVSATEKKPDISSLEIRLDKRTLAALGTKNRIACSIDKLPKDVDLYLHQEGTEKSTPFGSKNFELITIGEESVTLVFEAHAKSGVTQNSTAQVTLKFKCENTNVQMSPTEVPVTVNVTVGDPPIVNLTADDNFKKTLLTTPGSSAVYSLSLSRNTQANELAGGLLRLALLADGEDDRQVQWSIGTSADQTTPLQFDHASREWRWRETTIDTKNPLQKLVLVAKFADGALPAPKLRTGTITFGSDNNQLQIKPGEFKWELQPTSILDLSLISRELTWSPPLKDAEPGPQLVQLQLAAGAPAGPLQFQLTNADQPISPGPGEQGLKAPQIRFFLGKERTPVNSETVLEIPAAEPRILDLYWEFDPLPSEAKKWNYLLKLRSMNPNLHLRNEELSLAITTSSHNWRGEKPPGLLTASTRVWPFELFIPYGKHPADPKLYRFEYQFGEGADAHTVQGVIARDGKDNGEDGLFVQSADVLRELPQSFALEQSAQPKRLEVRFKLFLNDSGSEVEIKQSPRPVYIDHRALQPPQASATFVARDATTKTLEATKRKNGVEVYKVPGAGTVNLRFTSKVTLPVQDGPHHVKARRIFLLKSAAGTLDDALLRRLRTAAREPNPPADIAIFEMSLPERVAGETDSAGNSRGQPEFTLPNATNDGPNSRNSAEDFRLQVAAPHPLWITLGNTRPLRIVEQLTLANGMEEWQESRLEFQIPMVIPLLFYILAAGLVAAVAVVAWVLVLARKASTERKKYAAAMVRWLADNERLLLPADRGELQIVTKFSSSSPQPSVLAKFFDLFDPRHVRWLTFRYGRRADEKVAVHHLAFALGPKGLELRSSLPGTYRHSVERTARDRDIVAHKWFVIDSYDGSAQQMRSLTATLHLPNPPGASASAPSPQPASDGAGMLAARAASQRRVAQIPFRWNKPGRPATDSQPGKQAVVPPPPKVKRRDPSQVS